MADNNTINFNQVQKAGTFGGIVDAVNNNFELAKIAILNMKGKSAYEVWKDQEGNENKSVEEFLASLKESGFDSLAVHTRPTTNIDTKTIYCIPNPLDANEWTEEIFVGTGWIVLARHIGGLSNLIATTPHIESDGESDFSIKDEQDNAIVQFQDGHIKTKNFDSAVAATQSDLSELEQEIREDIPDDSNFPTIGDSDADLSIEDEIGNTIVTFQNGHIKTKNFDSENIDTDIGIEVGNSEDTDFEIKDEDGNAIVEFKGGHIKTRNFDSENIETTIPIEIGESEGDFEVRDEIGNVVFEVRNGHIKTKNFDSRKGASSTPYIYCIGDSVTQGQSGIDNPRSDNDSSASANCYPNRLQEMVGDKYIVMNLGVGGQKTGEILARNGLLDAIVKTAFTLNGDGTTSLLCSANQSATVSEGVIVDSCAGEPINYLMQQGTEDARSQMSRCYINGIQCTLSYKNDGTTQNPVHNLYIKRNDIVNYDLTIPVGSHITFGGNMVSDDNAIYCLRMGSNDLGNLSAGTQTVDNYIAKIKQSVARLNTNKWLIVGIFRGNTDYQSIKDEINEKLSKEFGARFIDGLGYISSYQAFYELGITPTTDNDISAERAENGIVSDLYCIEHRITPSSFWRYSNTPKHEKSSDNKPLIDNIHLNYDGYYLLAKMFYKKIKELNWI